MVNFMCQIGWVTVLIHIESNIILDVFVRVYLPIILIFKLLGFEESRLCFRMWVGLI